MILMSLSEIWEFCHNECLNRIANYRKLETSLTTFDDETSILESEVEQLTDFLNELRPALGDVQTLESDVEQCNKVLDDIKITLESNCALIILKSERLIAEFDEFDDDNNDDKLLKMVAELIAKESSENNQPKESNSFKLTSGNWSSLLLPPISQVNNITDAQHKQEIDKLQKRINELEESLREKNKTIRLQQQRINDIRKSFQKGSTLDNKLFDFPGNQNDNESTTTTDGSSSNNLTTSRSENGFIDQQQQQQQVNLPNHHHSNNHSHHHQRQLSDSQSPLNCPMNNISWQYLRSVIFKSVLTSDYEAQKHLVKAISMILQFSDAEEKQIRDSLEQKVSWFKNLPLLGNGFKYNNQHNNSNNSNHH
ncbi:FNIP repeat-containing protein DDB_G0290617-like [Panonychus citri]|uniref:FNIP repeat-containing protein DDB_G0290617-like n=1 Tax=Panonychus citri TaxID=50023 RepID=UPI0023076DE6|nr:FNIP repeat-containing protein DDB_G0290617-like [Panonychus citri]